jgi:hypothetical protein
MPIVRRSKRTLAAAMKKNGLKWTTMHGTPERAVEYADIFLQLLVNGTDFHATGSAQWYSIILLAPSPPDPVLDETQTDSDR